jgi:nucleotide-binding universal stress UspA family protein
MHQIVVPICDQADVRFGTDRAIALHRESPVLVHLLNVQRPLPKHVAQFFHRNDLRDFHRDNGMRVLEPAIRLLDVAGVPHEEHVLVGHPAETIVRFAEEHGCSEIVVDTPTSSVLSMVGLGSVASQVHHLMQAHAALAAGSSASPRHPGR